MAITGTSGPDTLFGTAYSDVIEGLGGDDSIFPNGGADRVYAGSGDDNVGLSAPIESGTIIEGGTGFDSLLFSRDAMAFYSGVGFVEGYLARLTGIEQLWFTSAQGSGVAAAFNLSQLNQVSTVRGGDGSDVLIVRAPEDGGDFTIKDFDFVNWTPFDDIVLILPGDDTSSYTYRLADHDSLYAVFAGSRDDTLIGGDGNDALYGDAGNDFLQGGDNADLMDGGEGTDTISYQGSAAVAIDLNQNVQDTIGSGIDEIYNVENVIGSSFDDILLGNMQANRLEGGAGNDFLYGGFSTNGPYDTLIGGPGRDTLVGNSKSDLLQGGTGSDTYMVSDWSARVEEKPGGGIDKIISSASFRLGANFEILELAETAKSGFGNDLDNRIFGNAAFNVLTGKGGNDRLYGRAGDDALNGGFGSDIINGGAGTDWAVYGGIKGGVAVDLAIAGAQDTGAAGIDTLVSIENLRGSNSDDVLRGNHHANRLQGQSGDDILEGRKGDDIYVNAAMDDTIIEHAGEGYDTVVSSGSFVLPDNVEKLVLKYAYMAEATGNDLDNLIVGNISSNVIDGRGGADIMRGGRGDDTYVVDNARDRIVELGSDRRDTVQSSIDWMLGDNLERLELTGADDIDGTGNLLRNDLVGNAGSNVLSGGNHHDTIHGMGGDDILNGDRGNDTLIGGLGGDVMVGGAGADVFVYEDVADSRGRGQDLIVNFQSGTDLISLSEIDAIRGGSDDAFTLVAAFSSNAGELMIEQTGVRRYLVSGDVDGNGSSNFRFEVTSAMALVESDFIL